MGSECSRSFQPLDRRHDVEDPSLPHRGHRPHAVVLLWGADDQHLLPVSGEDLGGGHTVCQAGDTATRGPVATDDHIPARPQILGG